MKNTYKHVGSSETNIVLQPRDTVVGQLVEVGGRATLNV